ncbi:MAG: transrane protein, partial [Gammaproteobacteria bacterium]|nr:transrane protein [Gammaproteobacteria bacterium]
LDGQFSIDVGKGRIINISKSSQTELGFGKMLNLLSLQSLPRRLTLDFSDLSVEGFAFDEMKGDFKLENGVANTQNAYLEGNVARIDLKGNIDLDRKGYNLVMLVTPYVTKSIPVVATIAGGPIAGAAAWVGQKILGGVIDTMTSSRYRVTGSWDQPNVGKF